MTTPTDIELQAAEWVIRMEGPVNEESWAQLKTWLDLDPRHRAAFIEFGQVWSRTKVLKTRQAEQRSLRERLIPELLKEQPEVREKLDRPRLPVVRALDERVKISVSVQPRPAWVTALCVQQALSDTKLAVESNTGRRMMVPVGAGKSPMLPVSTRKTPRG